MSPTLLYCAAQSSVCMYMYVCMYVCMYIHVYMYLCMYVCMYVCMYGTLDDLVPRVPILTHNAQT